LQLVAESCFHLHPFADFFQEGGSPADKRAENTVFSRLNRLPLGYGEGSVNTWRACFGFIKRTVL
jgi:hypothetical protein